jgi:hypothetical protein
LFLRNKYCITQFFHSKRLLDSDNPEAGTDLILSAGTSVNQYELSDKKRIIFNEVDAFWKEKAIGSASFGKAIEKFIKYYKLSMSVEKTR